MKKITLLVLVLLITCFGAVSQGRHVSVTPEYRPMTQQELEMAARAQLAKQAYNKQKFEEYKTLAYERLQVLDYNGFIYYSDFALKFGWYNDKMYYDRGQAFEKLHKYKKARKEYKKAIKVGYYPATYALEQCKANERKWKKSR